MKILLQIHLYSHPSFLKYLGLASYNVLFKKYWMKSSAPPLSCTHLYPCFLTLIHPCHFQWFFFFISHNRQSPKIPTTSLIDLGVKEKYKKGLSCYGHLKTLSLCLKQAGYWIHKRALCVAVRGCNELIALTMQCHHRLFLYCVSFAEQDIFVRQMGDPNCLLLLDNSLHYSSHQEEMSPYIHCISSTPIHHTLIEFDNLS